jgi:hypothetical protein
VLAQVVKIKKCQIDIYAREPRHTGFLAEEASCSATEKARRRHCGYYIHVFHVALYATANLMYKFIDIHRIYRYLLIINSLTILGRKKSI